MGCCAGTGILHTPCCKDSPAALSTPGSPSENVPAKLRAQTKYSLLPGDLGCTLERQEGVIGEGETEPRVQNSKSPPPPHVQSKFPVAPSKSLSPANPTLQPHPGLGTTHILSSASPPRPSFPETSGWKDAPGSGAAIRRLWPQGCLSFLLVSPGSTSVHILRSREGKSGHWGWARDSSCAATSCPRELSTALPAWEGSEGYSSGKLSVLCAGFLCARRHQ